MGGVPTDYGGSSSAREPFCHLSCVPGLRVTAETVPTSPSSWNRLGMRGYMNSL